MENVRKAQENKPNTSVGAPEWLSRLGVQLLILVGVVILGS